VRDKANSVQEEVREKVSRVQEEVRGKRPTGLSRRQVARSRGFKRR
jgi:hypothetical protein